MMKNDRSIVLDGEFPPAAPPPEPKPTQANEARWNIPVWQLAEPGWIGRVILPCWVWMVKERLVARLTVYELPADPPHRFGTASLRAPNDTRRYHWYMDNSGRGFDGSQLIVPIVETPRPSEG